jgi:hypothetical protein
MKLLAVISQHGLGHLAQAAPVLNALRKQQPDLALTIWSGLSPVALRARIEGPFTHRHESADVGLLMLVDQLDTFSLSRKRPVSLSMLKEIQQQSLAL